MRRNGLGAVVFLAVLAGSQLTMGLMILVEHLASGNSLPVWLAALHLVLGVVLGVVVGLELRRVGGPPDSAPGAAGTPIGPSTVD